MQDILDSFANGQGKQMVEQIDEFGVYDFLGKLENIDIDLITKYSILRKYLVIKNR